MNIPTKKLKCGFKIPALGLGTWLFGGDKKKNPKNDDATDIRAIQAAIDCGITHIDTAQNYAEGHAEELVGTAIEKYDRSQLFLTTKLDKHRLCYDDALAATEESLRRLKVNYIDLYLIHAPSPDKVPIQETMKALDRLVREGLIKNIGVSNFTVEKLLEAQACSQNKIVANQLHYNLIVREVERKGILNFCQEKDVMLIAFRPLQKGIIAQSDDPILKLLCQKYKKTPAQIALHWLIAQPNVVAITKMASLTHLKENLAVFGWEMEKADLKKLQEEYSCRQDVSETFPLDQF